MVVCGLHGEGLRVVEQLHQSGLSVVVVDDSPDQRLVRVLEGSGVPYLAADSRAPETLEAAGLAGATALICVESDDLHTLATALLARELQPGLRVVVQLRNAAVGRALQGIGVAVLDVAGLAAPSIVESCLGTGRWNVMLGRQEFAVVEAECRQDGTLRDLYGDLAPIAVVRRGGAQVEMTPGRDVAVVAGDVVVVLGTAADLDRAGLVDRPSRVAPDTEVFVGARAPRPQRVRSNPLLRQLIGGVDRRVKAALIALAALTAMSVTVLLVGYQDAAGRMSPLDALYFTVETIGTVGYGDFSFREQQWWLRLWAICLMVLGATLATVFFALLTNALIGRRIEETLGRRRITGLDDHVVLVGLGSIGIAVAERLRDKGVDVVVVERDSHNRFLGELRSARIPVEFADATAPATWAELHLERARAVAVMTSDDLVNIETGLAVRDLLGARWDEVPVVLRLFDSRLAATVEGSFDFRYVRSPAALAAPWFVGAALGLDVIDTFYVGDRPLLVARLDVRPGGGLEGTAMRELSARTRVVSLVRADGSAEHPPRRDTRFAAGDAAYLIGPYEELLALLRADVLAPVASAG